MTVRPTARWAVGVAAAALLLGASGCTSDPNSIAAQAKAGDQKGYVSGDGAVETIPAAKRGAPVELKGELLDGTAWDAASARGKVLVLNVWGSWCAPCVAEAPDLQKTWAGLQADQAPVQFMGIDFREDPARGAAFATKAGITYPSLSDEPRVAPSSWPCRARHRRCRRLWCSTREGRIAARVSGAVVGEHPARPRRRRRRRVVTPAAGTVAVLAAGDTVTSGALPLAVAIAAFAGFVSFASPCVLPLVPGFLGYVTGLTGEPLADKRRSTTVTGALLFVRRVHRRLRARLDLRHHRRPCPHRAPHPADAPGWAGRHRHGAGLPRHGDPARGEDRLAPEGRPGRSPTARRGLRARLGPVHRPDAGRGARAGQHQHRPPGVARGRARRGLRAGSGAALHPHRRRARPGRARVGVAAAPPAHHPAGRRRHARGRRAC